MSKLEIMEEKLLEVLGAEKFLQELLLAMSDYEEKENLEYIARNYEVDFE